MRLRFHAPLFVAVLLLTVTATAFGEEGPRSGFWGGGDIGVGRLERSVGGSSNAGADFYFGVKAGYTVHPQILVGAELSGWNQEATDWDDSTKGEGLMQVFLISRLYPMKDSNLFAKVGGGWVRQWENGPTGKTSLDGWGATLGIGYDVYVGDKWAVTPFLNYGFGRTEIQNHQAITLGVGVSFF